MLTEVGQFIDHSILYERLWAHLLRVLGVVLGLPLGSKVHLAAISETEWGFGL